MPTVPSPATAPASVAELQQRLDMLAGNRLGDIAQAFAYPLPKDLQKEKGVVGQLLEYVLGADSGNLSQPDFMHLGIELKTLPVASDGRPLESTYVSVVPMMHMPNWLDSAVYAKLRHVLWVPVLAERHLPLVERRLGQGIFWQPSEAMLCELQADYEQFQELIIMGEVETITAHMGQWLQIRPKAANSRVLTEAPGPEGQVMRTLPRGFYLRPSLTRQIIADWRAGVT